MRRDIEKLIAAQLLEAAREVLAHLSRWRIELNEAGAIGPPDLTQSYARVRRLKDYLQRCVSSYAHTVSLDLASDDENLLAACAVHALGLMELQLETDKAELTQRDRQWIEEKVKNLTGWAIQLASRPIERIPAPDAFKLNTTSVREVINTVTRRHEVRTPGAAADPSPGRTRGPQRYLDDPPGEGEAGAAMPPGTAHSDAGPPPLAAMDDSLQMGAGFAPMEASTPEGDQEAALPPELVDPRRLRDPRLRSMLVLDLRALERAIGAKDYRLAMVHLASLLEGAIIDYAIANQGSLGLQGTPEQWKMEDLLVEIAGDRIPAIDRALLYHLVAARNLIRPAVQLQQPMAVTPVSVRQAASFVRRALIELGMVGSASEPDAGPTPARLDARPAAKTGSASGFFQSTNIRRERGTSAPAPSTKRRGPAGGPAF